FASLRSNSAIMRSRRRVGSGYSISTTGDAMYSDSGRLSYRRSSQRLAYQVPSRCPSCGGTLNSEQVEWVGPLQAQCPYCLATVNAVERDF
ncbi:MAG: hypothetical protein ACXABY_25305, partial [Candidatus Thorarchaeota archaeon]